MKINIFPNSKTFPRNFEEVYCRFTSLMNLQPNQQEIFFFPQRFSHFFSNASFSSPSSRLKPLIKSISRCLCCNFPQKRILISRGDYSCCTVSNGRKIEIRLTNFSPFSRDLNFNSKLKMESHENLIANKSKP